jgi:demethylmenaquinone methyltransferase/2-methoxy-6-polyprenyl-1,4-benzoquinol methylase
VGLDFTLEMLARTPRKALRAAGAGSVLFAGGDALALPARDGVADVCTVAFGIRNVADRTRALSEMKRVTRPGGRVLVLEFTLPPGRVLGALYRFYFTRVLPAVGRSVSGDGDAYAYLPRTVLAWPSPDELEAEMARAGFEACGHRLLTRGIACIHWGRVPAADAVRGGGA